MILEEFSQENRERCEDGNGLLCATVVIVKDAPENAGR